MYKPVTSKSCIHHFLFLSSSCDALLYDKDPEIINFQAGKIHTLSFSQSLVSFKSMNLERKLNTFGGNSFWVSKSISGLQWQSLAAITPHCLHQFPTVDVDKYTIVCSKFCQNFVQESAS
jgi:hypothetical protein